MDRLKVTWDDDQIQAIFLRCILSHSKVKEKYLFSSSSTCKKQSDRMKFEHQRIITDGVTTPVN